MVSVDVKHHVYFTKAERGRRTATAAHLVLRDHDLTVDREERTLRASLSGTFLQLGGCSEIKDRVPLQWRTEFRQELCESRGSRPGFSVLMSLTVSVDGKQH